MNRKLNERTEHTTCGMGYEKCKNGLEAVNENSVAIVVAGNFETEEPTKAQLKSLGTLLKKLRKELDIPTGNIIGHTDASPTRCPGKNLLKYLPNHKHD